MTRYNSGRRSEAFTTGGVDPVLTKNTVPPMLENERGVGGEHMVAMGMVCLRQEVPKTSWLLGIQH